MKYGLGYTIYYDNLTHYKYYSKITNTNKPVYMFFHGLGCGIFSYVNLINVFNGENIIYVDIPHISLRKQFDYIDDRMLYITFENFIRQNGIKKINLIGQSYGSMIIHKILNKYEEYIDKIYLIESPIFLINYPYVVNNFYHDNKKKYLFIKYLVINELNIIQIFGRSDIIINQLANPKYSEKYICFLAESDTLIDSAHTIIELQKYNIKYYTYPGDHGEMVINKNIAKLYKNKIFVTTH